MNPLLPVLLIVVWVVAACSPADSSSSVIEKYQHSLVELELARKSHNYQLPWVTGRSEARKNGVVIDGNRLLTTADDVSGSVLVRVQKDGESRKYPAEFAWIDYYANLAVLTVDDKQFWENMEPVRFAEKLPQSGLLQILRWRNGRLEARSAEIERLFVGKSQTSFVQHLQLEVTSEIDAAGWAELIVDGRDVMGMTMSADGKSLKILPSPLIRDVLRDRASGEESGLGVFDFLWQPGTNPALLNSLGLEQTDQGIVVTRVGPKRLAQNTLQARDVILNIDGFPVDVEGKYQDPHYGRLSFENLATRNRMAGDTLTFTLWRAGEMITVDYQLPRVDFSKDLIPDAEYDQTPEYLIAGGFLFQPLTGPYLGAFGKNPPFLLKYYDYRKPLEREGLVVLSAVLPDPFNQGYEESRQLIVDEVNGHLIASLQDLVDALDASRNGYHRIQFLQDHPVQHLVLDAETMALATARVLERYRIPEDRFLRNPDSSPENAP